MFIPIIIGLLAAAYLIIASVKDLDWIGLNIIAIFILSICVICLGVIPLSRWDDRNTIRRINSTRQTLIDQRKQGNIENAAITSKIIEMNQDITTNKFYRTTILKAWTDPAYDTVAFLK